MRRRAQTSRSSEKLLVSRAASVLATTLLLAACGDKQAGDTSSQTTASAPGSSRSPANNAAPSSGTVKAASAAKAQTSVIAERSRELVNPDQSVMVMLYYDLAGVAPPIDEWIERQVAHVPALDKAARRAALRAEFDAGMAAVRNVGMIRLSLQSADLSDYDPSYGEFTVRALAPSSVIHFNGFNQKVSLKFGNGKVAQTWRVPAADAQAIRDKITSYGVSLDALLKITAVDLGTGGGTLTADVLEYEMRDKSRSGLTIARVRVGQP